MKPVKTQTNGRKKWIKMVQNLKMEIEPINKTQTEGNMKMKILGIS